MDETLRWPVLGIFLDLLSGVVEVLWPLISMS